MIRLQSIYDIYYFTNKVTGQNDLLHGIHRLTHVYMQPIDKVSGD